MSTICLAAQRSFRTGEPVWFSYRLPSLSKILGSALASVLYLGALLVAGLYAHIYWHLRHPVPAPTPVNVAQPEAQLSDMHYIYVSKPFPEPKPKVQEYHAPPLPSDDPGFADKEADWQQAPDSDISSEPLPDAQQAAQPDVEAVSLKERFMEALKEQQQDFSQGKAPDEPVDETSSTMDTGSQSGNHLLNQTSALKVERISAVTQKKSPSAFTHGDLKYDGQ